MTLLDQTKPLLSSHRQHMLFIVSSGVGWWKDVMLALDLTNVFRRVDSCHVSTGDKPIANVQTCQKRFQLRIGVRIIRDVDPNTMQNNAVTIFVNPLELKVDRRHVSLLHIVC